MRVGVRISEPNLGLFEQEISEIQTPGGEKAYENSASTSVFIFCFTPGF